MLRNKIHGPLTHRSANMRRWSQVLNLRVAINRKLQRGCIIYCALSLILSLLLWLLLFSYLLMTRVPRPMSTNKKALHSIYSTPSISSLDPTRFSVGIKMVNLGPSIPHCSPM